MRYFKGWYAVVLLLFFTMLPDGYASEKPIQKGEPFPDIRLSITKDTSYQKYLGVPEEGDFGIQDIKAEVVVIQIFHTG